MNQPIKRYILVITLALFVIPLNAQSDIPSVITITTSHYFHLPRFALAGNGTATIDWGDGSPLETVAFKPLGDNGYKDAFQLIPHHYSHYEEGVKNERIITVTGEIYQLNTGWTRQANALDVSRVPSLIALECSIENLTTLDVSNNPALEVLSCHGNRLTSLNIGGNSRLRSLVCFYNELDRNAILAIFNALPDHSGKNPGWIQCFDNPGVGGEGWADVKAIAEDKNWRVIDNSPFFR